MQKIYILMKNGWPGSAFYWKHDAENNLAAAELNEPKEHWFILEISLVE